MAKAKKDNHEFYLSYSAKINPNIRAVYDYSHFVANLQGFEKGQTVYAHYGALYEPIVIIDGKPSMADFSAEDVPTCYIDKNEELVIQGFSPDKTFAIVHPAKPVVGPTVNPHNHDHNYCRQDQAVMFVVTAWGLGHDLSAAPLPPEPAPVAPPRNSGPSFWSKILTALDDYNVRRSSELTKISGERTKNLSSPASSQSAPDAASSSSGQAN